MLSKISLTYNKDTKVLQNVDDDFNTIEKQIIYFIN